MADKQINLEDRLLLAENFDIVSEKFDDALHILKLFGDLGWRNIEDFLNNQRINNAKVLNDLGVFYWRSFLEDNNQYYNSEVEGNLYLKALKNVRNDFDEITILNNLALLYMEKGDWEKAERVLSKSSKLDSDNGLTNYILGKLKQFEGELVELSLHYYRLAEKSCPYDFGLRIGIVSVLYTQGNKKEARKEFDHLKMDLLIGKIPYPEKPAQRVSMNLYEELLSE